MSDVNPNTRESRENDVLDNSAPAPCLPSNSPTAALRQAIARVAIAPCVLRERPTPTRINVFGLSAIKSAKPIMDSVVSPDAVAKVFRLVPAR